MRLDAGRLAALRRSLILDSGPERAYDDITRLLASTLDVPIAMINLLDADRDWFKSRVGIEQAQSPAATSFCEAFFHTPRDVIVIEDTLNDPKFEAHPLVSGQPFVRFYAAVRLTVHGETFGTLCAYDVRPRQVSEEQMEQLRALANAAVELMGRRGGDGDGNRDSAGD
jgi:GAF domain-containing protein